MPPHASTQREGRAGAAARSRIAATLSEHAGEMVDFLVSLTEQEIAAGDDYFHATRIWFARHLPAPLVNDVGCRYMAETIRMQLLDEPDAYFTPPSPWQEELRLAPDRMGYRNYLAPGVLGVDLMDSDTSWALDLVADEFTRRRLERQNLKYRFEIDKLRDEAFADACDRATLSPPMMCYRPEEWVQPERTPEQEDHLRKYHPRRQMLPQGELIMVSRRPDWTLELMAQLAPDFPYAPQWSTRSRLVFMHEHEEQGVAWALLVEKPDGSPDYRYPPRLVLLRRPAKGRLRGDDILYSNLIGKDFFYGSALAQRSIEVELRFHVPRARKLIAFHQPYMRAALIGTQVCV